MRTEQGCENRVGYGVAVGNEAIGGGGGEGGRREQESREEEGREVSHTLSNISHWNYSNHIVSYSMT